MENDGVEQMQLDSEDNEEEDPTYEQEMDISEEEPSEGDGSLEADVSGDLEEENPEAEKLLEKYHRLKPDTKNRNEERFKDLISRIPFHKLSAFILDIRNINSTNPTQAGLTCTVDDDPRYGGTHMVYQANFSDGESWAIKFPLGGTTHEWTKKRAADLRAEALIMKLVKSKTTIPIPKVIRYDATQENPLGCPFIIMEWVEGRGLTHPWAGWDEGQTKEAGDKLHMTVLKELASYVTQLNQFSSWSIGWPDFDDDGKLILASTPEQSSIGNHKTSLDFLRSNLPNTPDEGSANLNKGIIKFLNMIMQWVEEESLIEDPRGAAVLVHFDLDAQNILVDQYGHIKALIDWADAFFAPRFLGNEAYPLLLRKDWFPPEDDADNTLLSRNHYDRLRQQYDVLIESQFESDKDKDIARRRCRCSHVMTSLLWANSNEKRRERGTKKICTAMIGDIPEVWWGFAGEDYGEDEDAEDTVSEASYDEFEEDDGQEEDSIPRLNWLTVINDIGEDRISQGQRKMLRDSFIRICT